MGGTMPALQIPPSTLVTREEGTEAPTRRAGERHAGHIKMGLLKRGRTVLSGAEARPLGHWREVN